MNTPETHETLAEAMIALKSAGYTVDFNLHSDWIESPSLNLKLRPEDFHIDEVHRFEGMTNPSDSAVLYAVSSNKGAKGLLVDAYGAYAESISQEMIQKLTIDRNTNTMAELRSPEQLKKSKLEGASSTSNT